MVLQSGSSQVQQFSDAVGKCAEVLCATAVRGAVACAAAARSRALLRDRINSGPLELAGVG